MPPAKSKTDDNGVTPAVPAAGAVVPASGDPGAATGTAPQAPAAAPVEAPRRNRHIPPDIPKAVEPSAAVREAPAHGHIAFVGHAGETLGPDDLFDDGATHRTWVLTRTRIYQKFVYPGTKTITVQLVYPVGAKVPREHAAKLLATMRSGATASEGDASGGDGSGASEGDGTEGDGSGAAEGEGS